MSLTVVLALACLATCSLSLPSQSNYHQDAWLLPRYGAHHHYRGVADNLHSENRVVEAPEPESFQGPLFATSGAAFPYNNIRLPSAVTPVNYKLHLFPNLTSFTFHGSADILVEAHANTDFIVYHRAGLVMTRKPVVEVYEMRCGAETIPITQNLENTRHQQGYLKLAQPLVKGKKYMLKFRFAGTLKRDLKGFYVSRYFDGGKRKYMAVTQFEATDARRAFPSFDEPAMKATFQVTLARRADHTSLSNMPVVDTHRLKSGLYADSFKRTVKMSSYLLAFVVSDFAKLEATTSTGIKVASHAPREQICQAQYALDVAVVILEHYEKFFGIPFPLPKMDMISVADFSAGAMENWGLVTFAQSDFLYDPETSSSFRKQRVAVVVAHEFAHQWFGNLVTMKWWNDIWLNEGFASFVEYIGTDKWNKNWKMLDQFIPDTLLRAMYRDAFSNSHPISVDVKDPNQIMSLFDTISYSKGASIIRMLESFMGPETLTKGLKAYLNKFKYGNAITNDLWDVLTETLGNRVNVKQMMNSWTNQMGYPLIKMTVGSGGQVTATQSRYLLDADHPKPTKFVSTYNYTWYVPLTYKTDTVRKQVTWMNLKSARFQVASDTKWVKANVDMLGYYRVQYDENNWKALADQLKSYYKVFSAADRTNLLSDSFEFTKTGDLKVSTALDLTRYLSDEPELVPWTIALDILVNVELHLEGLGYTNQLFHYYATDMMTMVLDAVVWDDTATHMQRKMRELIVRYGVMWNHPATVKKALAVYKEFRSTGKKPAADIYYLALRAAVENDKKDDAFYFVIEELSRTKNVYSRRTLIGAAATTKNPTLRDQFLQNSMDTTKYSAVEGAYALFYVAGSSAAGRKAAFEYLKANWYAYYARYGRSRYFMYWIVSTTTYDIGTAAELKEVRDFFAAHNEGNSAVMSALGDSVQNIQANIVWRQRHQGDVVAWLNKYFE